MMRWVQSAIGAWRAMRPSLLQGRASFIQLALPPICAGCESDLEQCPQLPLCTSCTRQFSMASESVCPRCAAPVPAAAINGQGCPYCREMPLRFQQATALGVYQGELRSFVLRMKHLTGESLSLAAGQLLGQHIRGLAWPEQPDLITAAPMHWTRRVWRNVNAPAVIAESTAKLLKAPLELALLRAARMVPRQSSLTADKRRRNMRGAFAVSRAFDVRDAHVLVIDDVMTTGATANALARPLLKAGARMVSIAVIARSILPA